MDIFGVRRVPYLARRNYYHEMRHILAWGVIAGMVEGNLAAIVVAKTFGGGDLLTNLAATTPVAAHMASLFWGTLCVGRPKIRLFTVCTSGVVLFAASVAATPASAWGAWLFIAQMAAAQFCMAGTVTLRSALWKSNYPQEVRGQIAARLQIVRSVTRLGAVAGAAWVFDLDPLSYRWVYPAAAVVGLVAIGYLRRVRVRGEERELVRMAVGGGGKDDAGALAERASMRQAMSPGHIMRGAWRVLKHDASFRHYLMAQMLAGFANLTVRSVVVVVITKHLLEGMGAGYRLSTVLLEVLPMLMLVVSMSRFARYFDRVGVLRFRVLHGACWTFNLLLGMGGTLAVMHADVLGPYAVVWGMVMFALFAVTRGICYAGGAIAWNLGHLHFSRTDDAEVYMGIHVSLTGMRGLIMPSVGILLWSVVGWWVWVVAIVFSLAAVAGYASLQRHEGALAAGGGDDG